MWDADGEGFLVDDSQVEARFPRLGTLTLTVNGTSYDIVGQGSGISKQFTRAQKTELAYADSSYALRYPASDLKSAVRKIIAWGRSWPRSARLSAIPDLPVLAVVATCQIRKTATLPVGELYGRRTRSRRDRQCRIPRRSGKPSESSLSCRTDLLPPGLSRTR